MLADDIVGESLTLHVEGRDFSVVADATTPKVIDLYQALAVPLRAAGWKVDVKDYAPNVYCALKFALPSSP